MYEEPKADKVKRERRQRYAEYAVLGLGAAAVITHSYSDIIATLLAGLCFLSIFVWMKSL